MDKWSEKSQDLKDMKIKWSVEKRQNSCEKLSKKEKEGVIKKFKKLFDWYEKRFDQKKL